VAGVVVEQGVVDERGPTRPRAAVVPLVALAVLTAAVWLALARLALAFAQQQLHWRYVAEQTRVGAPWPYRLAGVWGGMEGSLLLFAGIVGVAATVAARRATTAVRWAALATVGALVAVDLVLASPFGTLDIPAVGGFGLTPILEHPAMTIHPPLLYAGLAAALGAAMTALSGDSASARRWMLVTVGLLTVAMTLGAAWSYLEQGWGGYWAWDPVENTSLLVWLGALVAIHGVPISSSRTRAAMSAAPWVLAVVGAVLVRSGTTPSIHGFAEQRAVGIALAALAVATVAAVVIAVRRIPADPAPDDVPIRRDPRPVTVVLAGAATVVVLAGTLLPVAADFTADRPAAVRGEFYSRTVGPLALVAIPFLVGRLRRWRGWSTFAHAGALVLLAGIAASTFDRAGTESVPAGAVAPIAGVTVVNRGVAVEEGPRPGTHAVVADLVVAGRAMRPQIVTYPERGGRLAEVAARTGPFTDVQVVLQGASDDGGMVVTVHVRRLMWLVWLGALLVTIGALGATGGARRSRTGAPTAAAPASG
jgi:cytochrome c-type biogenesis protein CcmF